MIKRTVLSWAVVVACSIAVAAVAADAAKPDAIVGTWKGTLPNGMGGEIRVVLKVTSSPGGLLAATMDSPDQNASDIPVAKIAIEGVKVTLDVAAVGGSYEGTLESEKKEISGTWKQSGQAIPLLLKKEASEH